MSTPARRLIKVLHGDCDPFVARPSLYCDISLTLYRDAHRSMWLSLLKLARSTLYGEKSSLKCARHRRLLPLLVLIAPLLVPRPSYAGDPTKDCHIGTYRLTDHTVVDIAPSDDDALRWRRFDGTSGALTKTAAGDWLNRTGWTGRPDGKVVHFADCATGDISFAGITGHKIDFFVRETSIDRDGVKLAGRLVLPTGRDPVPLVVLVHGSESDSALDYYALQRMLPAAGIGVFVYDKRGTGASTGTFTMNFSVLADDAVAAMQAARRLAGARTSRVGYYGTSQGGWIAPLAAIRAKVDFVIVGYGLAVSPIEEDQEEAALDMKLRGYGPETMAKALEVTVAAEAMLQGFSPESVRQFQSTRTKYQDEAWFKYLHGNVTRFALSMPLEKLKAEVAPMLAGVEWNYDPMPVLRQQTTPQLWILGEDDLEAPSAETASRLLKLAAEGRPFTVALFPHAEHGIFEFETDAEGNRLDTRNPDGFFAMIHDFAAQGRLSGHYGAKVAPPPTSMP
jgi:pimeloyl-ACP methyl ester carboxylesterase